MQIVWREDEAKPVFGFIAGAVGALVLAASASMLLLFTATSVSAPDTMSQDIVPLSDSKLPRTAEEGVVQSTGLETRYPKGPRVRFVRALHFFEMHDLADAETQLRISLDQMHALPAELPGHFEPAARITLALTLVA